MRYALFIALLAGSLVVPWWLLLIAAVCYALRYPAYELIMLGVVLDAYYGVPLPFFPLPAVYTVSSVLIIVSVEALKPMLWFYERPE